MPWLLALWREGSGLREEDWNGSAQDDAISRQGQTQSSKTGPSVQSCLPAQPPQADPSPGLQVRRFGEGLVKAESAHQPEGVLSALALERQRRGDLGVLG